MTVSYHNQFVESASEIDDWLKENLVCPRDHSGLRFHGDILSCERDHHYPVVHGIPVMLLDEVEQTIKYATDSLEMVRNGQVSAAPVAGSLRPQAVDPFVKENVAKTCGILYRPLVGRLSRYPVPEFRLPPGQGRVFLDIGCNWGRWSLAAAMNDFFVVGLDPSWKLLCQLGESSSSMVYGVSSSSVMHDSFPSVRPALT